MKQTKANKSKYVAWIFLPCIIAFVLQTMFSIMAIEGAAVITMGSFTGGGFVELTNSVLELLQSDFINLVYVGYTIFTILILGFVYKSMFKEDANLSLRNKSTNIPLTIVGIVLFCISMQYVSVYLMNALASAFPSWLEEYEQIMETAGLDEALSPLMAIYALVLGPICEEFIFRGVTFSAAKRVMPYYMAIIVQAILFGAFHMNAIQGCYAFVLGLGMGYIMYLYDNLIITIIIHMAYNILGTVASEYLPMGGDTLVSFFVCCLGALIITYISLIILKRTAVSVKQDNSSADI